MIKTLLISLFLISKIYAQIPDSTRIMYDSAGNEIMQKYFTMPDTIESLKEENEKLKKELSSLKGNGAVGLYYELNRLVNETIAYTRNTTITSLLTEGEKGDKKFERTMALIKNAKEHVIDLEEIKNKLGLTGSEQKDRDSIPFIERIATKRD